MVSNKLKKKSSYLLHPAANPRENKRSQSNFTDFIRRLYRNRSTALDYRVDS